MVGDGTGGARVWVWLAFISRCYVAQSRRKQQAARIWGLQFVFAVKSNKKYTLGSLHVFAGLKMHVAHRDLLMQRDYSTSKLVHEPRFELLLGSTAQTQQF